jgi:hypothetical protein
MKRSAMLDEEWTDAGRGVTLKGIVALPLFALLALLGAISPFWVRWKNKMEAERELKRLVADQEQYSYDALRQLVGQRKRVEFPAATGTWYQAVIEVMWDDEPGGAIRVFVSLDCSAPRKSSHFFNFFTTELPRTFVLQSLVRTFLVVPTDPSPDRSPSLTEAREVVLPDALFLQAPEEPFDHSVLLGRVGRDELLLQSVVSAGLAKPSTLEDESVVGPNHWCRSFRSQGSESLDAGFLESPFRLSSSPT